ncbi:MAG: hypothetical protein IT431_07960 [Phycisphaerales bacterium]|nr:hypothetical protein [Phycisphaerales bacterium]
MERREATRPAVRELLCDRCGYSLAGTPDTPVCPECGLDFAASRAMRVGSPWQRRPSMWSWLKTVVLMIFRPRRTLGIVSFDNDDSNFRLFLCNVLIMPGCAFMLAAVVGLVSCMLAPASVQERIPVSGAVFVASIVLVAGLVMWLAAGLALYFSGRQVIRWACRPSPEIWRGSHVLAVHASCVVAPASGALLINQLFGFPEYGVPVLAVGVLWFLALCLVASRWPDRTAAPGGE